MSITTTLNNIESDVVSITTNIDKIDNKIIYVQQIITENIETTMVATRTYQTGDYLIANNSFYKTISPINNGDNIVVGINVKKTTIAEQLTQTKYLRK